jgi:geranylgeranyl pyrophosphate synthase
MAGAASFAKRLAGYKQAIDTDIATYSEYVRKITGDLYGPSALLETETYLDVLARGGKRLRGALVMVGYEMSGGTNRAMIVQAARAIEMLHAYMLIIDDIQDRSELRRGKPSAHEMLAAYHRKHHLRGDAAHTGISLALMSALVGAHAAQGIIANLDADQQLRLNVLSIINRTFIITGHGQTQDIMNELVDKPSAQDIDRVLEWKTALYSFINPLHVGMVLADADCSATDAITPYAREVGKAFQIADDLLGVFGNEEQTGKSAMDDIREGKRTVLSQYALEHAAPEEQVFLQSCLGNADLTLQDFKRCKQIIEISGAREFAAKAAAKHAAAALVILDKEAARWNPEGVAFLRQLAHAVQDRKA